MLALRKVISAVIVASISFLTYPDSALASINADKIAKSLSQLTQKKVGTLGVGVRDLESGQSWYLNGETGFRMQSVAKVPIAVAALRMVDEGKLKLDNQVAITSDDVIAIRGAAIPDSMPLGTPQTTLRALLNKSVCYSNNGAADVILRLVGGPAAVTQLLASSGLKGIRVDRSEKELVKDESRPKPTAPSNLDTATPAAICDMLEKLQNNQLLSPSSSEVLLSLMYECKTGDLRLKAGFPAGTKVAHKTGTGGTHGGKCSATNDVGIVVLPSGKKFAVAVFLFSAPGTDRSREDVISTVAGDIFAAIEPGDPKIVSH